MTKKAHIPTEEQDQSALAKLLDMKNLCWFHPPNGGLRHVIVAEKLKAQGVKSGVPDVLIFDRPPAFPGAIGVAIELKRSKGGTVSKEQKIWHEKLIKRGWIVRVCRGIDEALAAVKDVGF